MQVEQVGTCPRGRSGPRRGTRRRSRTHADAVDEVALVLADVTAFRLDHRTTPDHHRICLPLEAARRMSGTELIRCSRAARDQAATREHTRDGDTTFDRHPKTGGHVGRRSCTCTTLERSKEYNKLS